MTVGAADLQVMLLLFAECLRVPKAHSGMGFCQSGPFPAAGRVFFVLFIA